ncbi:MAG: LEA type 2 family protein [Bacteroidia bacterium]
MSIPKKLKIVLIIVLIFAIAISILFYVFNPRKALNLIIPDIESIAFIDAKIRGDSLFSKIDVIVQNKSPYRLTIDSIYYKINLSDLLVAEELVPLQLRQRKFQIDTVKLPLNVSFKKIRKTIASLQKFDSTTVNFQFYVVYNTIFGHVKIDYDKTKKIAVPVPPQIKVLSTDQKKYNFRDKTLTANVTIGIINKGKNIDMELSNIHYSFVAKNSFYSEKTLNQKIRIKPSSTATVVLPVTIKIEHPLKTAISIVTDNDIVDYKLMIKADMKLNNMNNNDQLIPVNFDATGSLELKK